MTCEEFKELVKRMRKAQQNFFATRNVAYLKDARKIEKEVDDELSENPKITQKKMF